MELTENYLGKIAGWEAMKQARALLDQRQVLSSNWTPPVLKGVVQSGGNTYRAGLVIKDAIDVENLCSCRPSREWGTICAHSVAVGLHHLKPEAPAPSRNVREGTGDGAKPDVAVSKRPEKASRLRLSEAGGEPAELHVILPPQPAPAIERGKIMVCFEADWSQRRGPLESLPRDRIWSFPEADRTIVEFAEELAGGTPAMLMLGPADFSRLLSLLIEHPRVTLGKSIPATVAREGWRVPVKATLESSGRITLRPATTSSFPSLLVAERVWCFAGATFRPLSLPVTLLPLLQAEMKLERQQVPLFLSRDWPTLQSTCEVEANFNIQQFRVEPAAPRFLLSLTGGLARLQAVLQCAYGSRIMTLGVTKGDEAVWLPDPQDPTRYGARDTRAEREALGRLLRVGFAGPDDMGRYQLTGEDQVLAFFAREYPRMRREWEVSLEERLERSTQKNLEWVEPSFSVTAAGERWFDLAVSFEAGNGERFSAADIQRLILSGRNHRRLRNGKTALLDTGAVEELQEVLLDCSPAQNAGRYRIDNAQAGFLAGTICDQAGWNLKAPADWRERVARQNGKALSPAPPLGELENVLRPYQKSGVAWLHFLRENGFGGILADEMGLGKTLQALALLQTKRGQGESAHAGSSTPAEELHPAMRLPSLVVCPTSLVFNWMSEAARFAPQLRVLALQGAQRHGVFDKIRASDLVVTSYALIRRDADRYREFEFDTVILDEAQHIKNRQTQNAQAVKAVRGRHRVVLTGTPLENSVSDLWSIFDFLMPGYLGSARDFRDRYEVPIVRGKDAAAQDRLARRLRPFILRRLKKEVAADLPEKLEQVAWCELTDEQGAIYQQILQASRAEVMEAVGDQGLARSRMVVLNALLRLRQVCCDLRLLKLEGPLPEAVSGKMELFEELLEEVLDGGHRVLVFSQFVSMLTLLRERLEREGVPYSYLDGSTSDRAAVVNGFQSRSDIPVFLISLKAGGVGLNLTAADTVIHFDPWWNPAVEAQATDRAHRIGQTKVVTSYKLITRGTVEEKILLLQNRKREMIQGMLGGDAELTEALTWEELQELLAD